MQTQRGWTLSRERIVILKGSESALNIATFFWTDSGGIILCESPFSPPMSSKGSRTSGGILDGISEPIHAAPQLEVFMVYMSVLIEFNISVPHDIRRVGIFLPNTDAIYYLFSLVVAD